MSVGPRIVFVRFLTGDSPKLVPWMSHTGRIMGQSAEVALSRPHAPDGIVVWNLVSANNRELARGLGTHETFEAAHAHASSVVDEAMRLDFQVVSEGARGVYGWFASLDDVPVMTSARWYATARDRHHSIQLATRSIPVATLHVGARLTHPSQLAGDRGTLV